MRDDAYYAPTSDGICILSNSGQVVLTGPSIFRWVDRLAPYLDGSHTLTELTASMPADRRDMTERVIEALRAEGVVVEATEVGGQANPLTGAEREAYRREIGFLGYFGPAERSFQAYRHSKVVLVGAGQMIVETVAAALCSGSRRLRVVVTSDCPTDGALLAEYERRSRQRDPAQQIMRTAADLAHEDQLSDVVDGAGIVVYASDRADVDTVRRLDQMCGQAGIPFVPAILARDEAWLGPFGPVGGEWPGWMSAWRRLLAMAGKGAEGPQHGQDELAPLSGDLWVGAAPTVVANQLIRELVRLLSSSVDRSRPAELVQIDLRSLRTRRHPFAPHPFSLAAGSPGQVSLRSTVGRLRAAEYIDTEDFSRRMTTCLQPRLGVLGEVTERDFTQVPLALSQVEVSDPVRLLGPGVPLPVVIGAGLSLDDARRAAVLRGLSVYGSLMVDPRRLHVRPGAADPRTDDPEQDLTALLRGEWNGFVWGSGLADGRLHELPAARVFPALGGVRSGYVPPAGVAAGYDWSEAVRHGLVSHCRRLTLAEVAESRHSFTPINWKTVALDARGARYRSMATILATTLDVYDVTGSPGIPTFAMCVDGVTVAYASGFSFEEALGEGLAQVLVWHQTMAGREVEYALDPVPQLPPHGRLSDVAVCPTWSIDEADAVARLARLGWTAVAVPLDHDPAVTASIMPYLVNIVLTRA
jgi:hypothetical protein